MISSETALVPRLWHGPLPLVQNQCFLSLLLVKLGICILISTLRSLQSLLSAGTQPFGTEDEISRISRIVLATLQVISKQGFGTDILFHGYQQVVILNLFVALL